MGHEIIGDYTSVVKPGGEGWTWWDASNFFYKGELEMNDVVSGDSGWWIHHGLRRVLTKGKRIRRDGGKPPIENLD